ncbi:GAF domain-containing protein [Candidatus Bathyarchaeota archaeon]|nr:MAG: GAF domain-containing protein [Candidatus Bathyarchaeota archaeon]
MIKCRKLDSLLGRIKEIANSRLERDEKLRSICKLLRENFTHFNWVGFYLASGNELVLGPFEGEPTEPVRIPFGKGVCGRAAQPQKTLVVQDVSKEINYLACSPKVKSEIVVPILKNGNFVGELDIDSHMLSAFTEEDRKFLEKVCEIISNLF